MVAAVAIVEPDDPVAVGDYTVNTTPPPSSDTDSYGTGSYGTGGSTDSYGATAMIELLADPEAWIALGTLTALELVLGIETVKSMGAEDGLRRRMMGELDRLAHDHRHVADPDGPVGLVPGHVHHRPQRVCRRAREHHALPPGDTMHVWSDSIKSS